ncbi:hypothetical protein EJB05_54127, partial [Eragrostis curvula]
MSPLSSRGALSGATAFAVAGVEIRRAGSLSLAVPAGGLGLVSIKGGRLAVVASAAAAPAGVGGDDGNCKDVVALAVPKVFSNTGAGTRRCGMSLCLASPGGPPSSKRGQLAVVAAAGAAQGSIDDVPSPSDPKALATSFRMELELFKMEPRPVQFDGPLELLDLAAMTAQNGVRLLEFLLAHKTIDENAYKDVLVGGKAFVTVEGQRADGYLRSDALIDATQSILLAGKIFFPNASFAACKVSRSGDDFDKKAYFATLLMAFLMYYTAVAGEAKDTYGFKMTGLP